MELLNLRQARSAVVQSNDQQVSDQSAQRIVSIASSLRTRQGLTAGFEYHQQSPPLQPASEQREPMRVASFVAFHWPSNSHGSLTFAMDSKG